MHIVYYVTSHGYGHGVRTVAIANALHPWVRITFRTTLPERFFKEEVRRPFIYAPAEFDCGCVQTDSLTTDKEETRSRYLAMARNNERRLKQEAAWCREAGADVVVSDITPFAFDVAAVAGLPSVAVTNFTWYDVYQGYFSGDPLFAQELSNIHSQYARAGLLLALTPALPMDYFPCRKEVPPVGRAGRNRHDEIAAVCGIAPGKKIALIYFGHFGLDGIDWKRLESFRQWEFLGVFPLPTPPANYHVVVKKDFPYQDLVASSDLMICKIGYGVTAECMLHGTPLFYIPRDDFAESPVLEIAIKSWGYGHRLTVDAFKRFDWGAQLESIGTQGRAIPVTPNGAAHCAREIERMAGKA